MDWASLLPFLQQGIAPGAPPAATPGVGVAPGDMFMGPQAMANPQMIAQQAAQQMAPPPELYQMAMAGGAPMPGGAMDPWATAQKAPEPGMDLVKMLAAGQLSGLGTKALGGAGGGGGGGSYIGGIGGKAAVTPVIGRQKPSSPNVATLLSMLGGRVR